MQKKETIKLSGMSCAGCAAKIEKTLNQLDGVRQAAVNFAVENAAVEYDSAKVNVAG
jgi:Cu+-exporting ATPase